jgi:hypothetical protein
MLRQVPVTAVASVYLDNGGYFGDGLQSPFGASSLLVDGQDYAVRFTSAALGSTTGIIYRINGTWTQPTRRQMGYVSNLPGVGNGNIKVTYTAGYTSIPADIAMAVNMLVIRIANMAATGMIATDEAYEDASLSYLSPKDALGLIGTLETVLGQYREQVV